MGPVRGRAGNESQTMNPKLISQLRIIGLTVALLVSVANATQAGVQQVWVAEEISGRGVHSGSMLDAEGNLYVTGSHAGGSSIDYLTAKFGPEGNLIWQTLYDEANA